MSGIYQVYTIIINFLGFPDVGQCSASLSDRDCRRNGHRGQPRRRQLSDSVNLNSAAACHTVTVTVT